MRRRRCCWSFALLFVLPLVAVFGAGCNPFAPLLFTAYLTGADMEQRIQYKFPDDCRRVAVVSYVPYAARADMGHFDRDLNEKVARSIFGYFESKKINHRKEVVKASRVHEWQAQHPNWMNMDPGEIGRALNVDYLVFMEVGALSLYEECSNRTLYKGHAELMVKVYRITPEMHEVAYANPMLIVDFPSKDRSIPVDNISFPNFRDRFVDNVAKRLSWVFVPHETSEEFDRAPF